MYKYFNNNNDLADQQYGFRKLHFIENFQRSQNCAYDRKCNVHVQMYYVILTKSYS